MVASVCAVVAALLAVTGFAQSSTRAAADTVFVGRIVTLEERKPVAEAMAVKDGRIAAIGTEAEVSAAAGGRARRVRLPGVAVPGLADAHVHALALGEQLELLDLRGLTKGEILLRVAGKARETPAGGWVQGRGWDQGFWNPVAFPTAADLDRVAANHPVLLTRIDGHSVWMNSAAMKKSGIGFGTPDPEGGRFLRGPDGEPSGVAVDRAADLAVAAVPPPTAAENERRLRAALRQLVEWGVTSIHDAGVDLDTIAIYKRLLARGELPLRVYAMAEGTGRTADHYLAAGPELDLGDGRLTIRSFKVMLDGALGSRGAQLLEPYTDAPEERGLQLMSDAALGELVTRASAKGFQVNAHAIGDLAVRRALDAFERFGGPNLADRRFRVEHASMNDDADLPRFARLHIVASMQPGFVGEYSRWAIDRVGPSRVSRVMRTAELIRNGAVVASGTDYPAADSGNPLVSLYCMVTRRGARGEPQGGWHPDQRVDVATALRAMTRDAAFAAFQERDLGSLVQGRRADLTVLTGDPITTSPAQLRNLAATMTIVGGEIVHGPRESR
jgi:hypothetical protein